MAAEGSSEYGWIREPAYLKTLAFAALLGMPAAFCAVLFTSLVHAVDTWLWTDLPEEFGWIEPAWWYVLLLPALGGLVVALCLRLPGKGGPPAIEGLGLHPAPLRDMPSILIAAGASLVFGLIVGPEAPLLAIGLALGAIAAKLARSDGEHARSMVLAGAFAAIASVLGGPIVSAFMIFELVAAAGMVPSKAIGHLLLPGFIASGTGYLIFAGVSDWPGFDVPVLSVPGLPEYVNVRIVDIGWCVLLAIGVAFIVVATRRFAHVVLARMRGRAEVVLIGGGLAVGAIAVLYRALTDHPADLVLFSGQASLPEIVAEGSASALAVLLLFKALAFAITMAAGFRGGLVFPVVSLGVIAGVLASLVLPGLDLTPAVVAGIAAAAASGLTLPFFGALLAALLGGTAGANAIPIAIIAAAVAWLVTLELEHPRSAEPGRDAQGATAGSGDPS